jgi:hypothetical protein
MFFMLSHTEIMKWLLSNTQGYSLGGERIDVSKSYVINKDGEVDCFCSIQLTLMKSVSVPFNFGTIQGSMRCGSTSLKNLSWLPSHVGGTLDVSATGIKSFTGISTRVKYVGNSIALPSTPIPSHCLGLLLIGGAPGFTCSSDEDVARILNNHRGTGDIIAAQDELIDAGYIDQARM